MARTGTARTAVVGLLVVSALAWSGAPAVAAQTCDGKTATIVGKPGSELRGTKRADVIVSNGAGRVVGLGGNDRICLTGSSGGVDAGLGHDRVFVRHTVAANVYAELGPGDDVFVGGAGSDIVFSGAAATGDRIYTGPGRDQVTVAQSSTPTLDVVKLGLGADYLQIAGTPVKGSVFEGNGGVDFLRQTHVDPTVPDGRITFDNQDEVARVNGAVVLQWDSFQRFQLPLRAEGIYFRGSHRPEGFHGDDVVGASMGGGDDSMSVGNTSVAGLLRGGAGRDRIVAVGTHWSPIGDIAAGRIDDAEWPGVVASFAEVEDLTLGGNTVRVVGDSGPNGLHAYGCSVEIIGNGGDDILSTTDYGDVVEHDCTDFATTMSGGGGDDQMSGGSYSDSLYGGAGLDTADGQAGTDLCRAETQHNCEME
jgi:Ca2+-binding RTX toxin-like protein